MIKSFLVIILGIITIAMGIRDLLGKSKVAYYPKKSLKRWPQKIDNPIVKKLSPVTIGIGVIIFVLGIVTLIIN